MISIEWGRRTKPDLKIGICGEHGGHPESVEFCHAIGLSYVSCSVPRLPVARLAAAHAKLKQKVIKPPEKYDPTILSLPRFERRVPGKPHTDAIDNWSRIGKIWILHLAV